MVNSVRTEKDESKSHLPVSVGVRIWFRQDFAQFAELGWSRNNIRLWWFMKLVIKHDAMHLYYTYILHELLWTLFSLINVVHTLLSLRQTACAAPDPACGPQLTQATRATTAARTRTRWVEFNHFEGRLNLVSWLEIGTLARKVNYIIRRH